MAEEDTTPTNKEKAWISLLRRLVVIYGIAGVAIGYVSYTLNQPLHAMGITIVVFIALHLIVKKALNPEKRLGEKRKWWATPLIVYFGLWLVVWTIFFNVFIVQAL